MIDKATKINLNILLTGSINILNTFILKLIDLINDIINTAMKYLNI